MQGHSIAAAPQELDSRSGSDAAHQLEHGQSDPYAPVGALN